MHCGMWTSALPTAAASWQPQRRTGRVRCGTGSAVSRWLSWSSLQVGTSLHSEVWKHCQSTSKVHASVLQNLRVHCRPGQAQGMLLSAFHQPICCSLASWQHSTQPPPPPPPKKTFDASKHQTGSSMSAVMDLSSGDPPHVTTCKHRSPARHQPGSACALRSCRLGGISVLSSCSSW